MEDRVSKIEFKPESKDGSTIVVLSRAFKHRGDDMERVTIPALTGKHMMRLPMTEGEVPTVGQLIEWANWVVTPLGCVEDMHPSDALDIARRVYANLGKSLTAGETTSE